ncbi:major facilitator superfamily transporter [Nitzschia inconspicua]|uniref:Major facilitator superfamily transporter n=1 Tax=Nitzschia inconspicua TaxID=303405 RepID=A0A9K3LWB3_9STRA|nr:major facilitator superfamily transporter [Nitzschia inconspicua]
MPSTSSLAIDRQSNNSSPSSYQNVETFDDELATQHNSINTRHRRNDQGARRTLLNFVLMSILFSANHGCVVSCLGLASARLGSIGAWQSGILYITYTASALLGATYIVKKTGARNSLLLGMLFYCFYVACFWVGTLVSHDNISGQRVAAYTGAAIGGIGAGFLWTAQGAYFGLAAEDHASRLQQPVETSTASLAGIFAFFYLAEEVLLRLLSSFLLEFHLASWGSIFGIYTFITVLSTMAISCIYNYPKSGVDTDNTDARLEDHPPSASRFFYKLSSALQLLINDPKMKYMVGLNAVFGFTASFLNSYVNGQVVPAALNDPDSKYIGVLSSWVSAVAAGMSLVFGRLGSKTGKGPILILGALCFFGVVFPFVLQPNASKYGWPMLVIIYSLHGTGRATFEGTLKATFADYFPHEKEGAFANIILQNGLAGAVGYFLTFSLQCDTPSRYCIEYSNGTLHDVLSFELVVIVSAILAIIGYLRASAIHKMELEEERNSDDENQDDNAILLIEERDT